MRKNWGGAVDELLFSLNKDEDECRVYYTLNVTVETYPFIFFPDPMDPNAPAFPQDVVLQSGSALRCPENPPCQAGQERSFCNFPQLPSPPFQGECDCGYIEAYFVKLSDEQLSELSQIQQDNPGYVPAYHLDAFDVETPINYVVVSCDLLDGPNTFKTC